MRVYYYKILFTGFLILGITFVFPVGGRAIDASTNAQNLSLIAQYDMVRLINQARRDPLGMASRLGLDPEDVLENFPEMHEILLNGLPPLTFNRNLYEAARAHTEDMLKEGYYAHDSIDGRTYDDRIREAGYLPVATGESLGLSGFSNFIDSAESARTMFERLFRDELDPACSEQRNILNPALTHVGIALGAGTLNLDAVTFNAYIVTCDFATGPVSDLELAFVELINQAREKPLAMARALGMDTDQILADVPELYDILTKGLPPLTSNLNLHLSAAAHAVDMLDNEYYSYTCLDGRTIDDRIFESGYDALVTGEVMRLFATTDSWAIDQGAAAVFHQMFARELSANCPERYILSPEFKEVGVRLAFGSPRIWDESADLQSYSNCYTLLLVADFGACDYPRGPFLTGRVYQDLDENGLYTIGEGIGGAALSIEGPETDRHLFADPAGGFTVHMDPGVYRIALDRPDQPTIEKWVEMGDDNMAVEFRVTGD